MMKNRLSTLIALTALMGSLSVISLRGDEFVRFAKSGELLINDNVKLGINHFDGKWAMQSQKTRSVNIKTRTPNHISGTFTTKGGQKFDLEEHLNFPSKYNAAFSAQLTNPNGIETRQLCMSLSIPIKAAGISVDGKKITPPPMLKKMLLFHKKDAKEFVYQLPDSRLVISGKLSILVQDNRRFKMDSLAVRLLFTPANGNITNSKIAFNIRKEFFDASSIDISNVVNMGFADEQANDKQGGWTDQGPANDLSMIKPGQKRYGGIPFNVINPAQNGGKSCLVMAGPDRSYFPKTAEIDGKNARFKFLYFLHTAAWARKPEPYGIVEVLHTDGSKSKFDVVGKRDVADWWGSFPLDNGAVVWTGENKQSYVGLFMSKFKIADKPINKIKLSSTGNAVWMIVGLSGTNEDFPLPKDTFESYTIAGKEWQPFTHSLDVEKGSALDMSFLTEAPAGKYGRVIAKNGRFCFEQTPDKPVRFYGTNLCFSANYLSKEECEQLADRLVAYGYNSVRIHHQDRDLVDKHASDSLTIIPEQMDKLDYMFYCLKKRGIYITTDLFISRSLKAAEVSVLDKNSRSIKALAPLCDDVMANVKEFAKRFLNHVNPYTGLAWKDDPALFAISFINENSLAKIWNKDPVSTKLYEDAFAKWAVANNISTKTEKERAAALTQFITNMQIRSYEVVKDYVKNTLGCKALYSDCNMSNCISQVPARDKFDYVDNHAYWDHPIFPIKPWNLPSSFHNSSVLTKFCKVPRQSMPTRIFGKPFAFTEFNYVFPNQHRAEGNAVVGALASLQDWDALYRFAFAHYRKNATKIQAINGFDVATDPLTLLGERIVTLMFRRHDVQVARQAVPFLVTPECAQTIGTATGSGLDFPDSYDTLGLIHRIGSMITKPSLKLPKNTDFAVTVEPIKQKLPKDTPLVMAKSTMLKELQNKGKLSAANYDPKTGHTLSDTGQISLNTGNKTFSVVTEKSECFVLPAGKTITGNTLSVKDNTAFATIFAGSLDRNNLARSRRILILHLTDVKNTKTKFIHSGATKMMGHTGKLPHLVRSGKMSVTLKTTQTGQPTLWALDVTGKRVEKVNTTKTTDGISFEVNTTPKGMKRMAYELVW